MQRSPASRLVMGRGVVGALAGELTTLGVSRPMVLAGARTRQSSLFASVAQALGSVPWVDTAAVPSHSRVDLVESLTVEARARDVDGFVSVGGGSAVDTAKAIAILLAEGGRLADHAVHFTPPATLRAPSLRAPKLPIVAIPSTASGAEVTGSVGIRDASGAKLILSDPQVAARLVLLDAHAGLQVSASVLCSTAMNALAHGIEGLYSRERTPMAETHALESLARLAQAIPAVSHNHQDENARAQLLYAAHLAGLVLVNARTCLHHALCHVIGSVTGAAHGEANAVMLPHCVAFNAEAAAAPLARAAQAVGAPGGPEALVGFIRALQTMARVPRRLRDIGVPHAALDTIAHKAMHERGLHYNPRPVTGSSDVLALLEAAY
ncbi:iron-containing alcohol dehydrogenase family protein [Verticiella sediminum]